MANNTNQGISRGFTGRSTNSTMTKTTITTTSIWKKPADALLVYIFCIGGGGGGGSGGFNNYRAGGSGASGGGCDLQMFVASGIQDNLLVTIGSGGSGGTATGSAGNGQTINYTTSFGVRGNDGGSSYVQDSSDTSGVILAKGQGGRYGTWNRSSTGQGGSTHHRGMFDTGWHQNNSMNYHGGTQGKGGSGYQYQYAYSGSPGQTGGGGGGSGYWTNNVYNAGHGGRGSTVFNGLTPSSDYFTNEPSLTGSGLRMNYTQMGNVNVSTGVIYRESQSYFSDNPRENNYPNVNYDDFLTYDGGGAMAGNAAGDNGQNGADLEYGASGGSGGTGIQQNNTSTIYSNGTIFPGAGGNGGFPGGGGGGGGSFYSANNMNSINSTLYPDGNRSGDGGNGGNGKVVIWTVGSI